MNWTEGEILLALNAIFSKPVNYLFLYCVRKHVLQSNSIAIFTFMLWNKNNSTSALHVELFKDY